VTCAALRTVLILLVHDLCIPPRFAWGVLSLNIECFYGIYPISSISDLKHSCEYSISDSSLPCFVASYIAK